MRRVPVTAMLFPGEMRHAHVHAQLSVVCICIHLVHEFPLPPQPLLNIRHIKSLRCRAKLDA